MFVGLQLGRSFLLNLVSNRGNYFTKYYSGCFVAVSHIHLLFRTMITNNLVKLVPLPSKEKCFLEYHVN